MTPREADTLAVKITQSWPASKIPTAVWAEDIADLDAGHTGTAIVRLRRTLDRPPTIAELRHEVHTMTPRPPGPRMPTDNEVRSFIEHVSHRVTQAAHGNEPARAEVERWIAAANGRGFAAAILGPRLRTQLAAALQGHEDEFTPLNATEEHAA